MAMTKAEAAKLTQDLLLRGVIETVIKESQLLQLLPFMEVTGTAVTYNREATLPAASFYDVGDTWTEATPTFTTVTAGLKIMGGDADVDNFLQSGVHGAITPILTADQAPWPRIGRASSPRMRSRDAAASCCMLVMTCE
jgi:hypothetical protein